MTEPRRVLLAMRSAGRVFTMGQVQVHALRDVTLEVFEGELLVIVGPSGSGKSTLLNLVGGMDRPTSGSVTFLERDLATASDRELTAYRRDEVGFVFQFYNLVPTLTALENVLVVTELVGSRRSGMEMLELVGLADRAHHFPAQLSGGEQQRVAIARALAGNPRLLLCDEPTGALDREMSRQVLGLLVKLQRELSKTVVLITHNGAIAGISDRIALLRDGTLAEVRVNPEPTPVDRITW